MGSINIEKLTELRDKVVQYLRDQYYWKIEHINNEEQTKNWLILPFLSALGYDTQSTDVVPEVTADFSKKGEKVDYMLQVDNLPVALIECKKFGESLDKHINQLYRYFQAKNVHIGILTNGVSYHFFTDSKRENVMDRTPFLKFDISSDDLDLLNAYTKDNILQAPIPSIVNKRNKQEQQKEQEISGYKHQISDYESKINDYESQISELNKQKDEPSANEQIYSAMLVRKSLELDKLEKENKELKEKEKAKGKPKKEKKIYGGTDLDKHKVPTDIARDMVALLPEEVFVPEAKFFDPFCRYGELLIAVKDRLMQSQYMIKAFPDEDDREDHIRDNQLYAFVIDEKGLKDVTRIIHRTAKPREPHVVCFGSEEVYKKAMKSDSKVFIVDKLKELGQMKFDVVIGNPPYNNDMYLDFVQMCVNTENRDKYSILDEDGYACFITPAKWQAKGGQKNEEFRKNIVPHMSKIVYYPCAQELFDIRNLDGISYYLLGKNKNDVIMVKNKSDRLRVLDELIQMPDSLILLNSAYNIINKINCKKGIDINVKSNVFGIGNPDIRDLHTQRTSQSDVLIPDASLGKGMGKMDAYISINLIKSNHELIPKYKVTMLGMGGNCYYDNNGTTLGMNKTYIRKPNEVTTNDYICMYTCDTLEEALSYESYIQTKLVRFLVMAGLVGQRIDMEETWRFVPQPEAFDHIFTDQELYDKYRLTDEEIDIIESVIKERK